MRKILLAVFVAVILIGCGNKSRETTIAKLEEAVGNEILASANYSAFATQARVDSLPQIVALFRSLSESKAINVNNLTKIFDEYGQQYSPQIGGVGFHENTSLNLELAILSEKNTIEIYTQMLMLIPRRDETSLKMRTTQALENSREELLLLEQALAKVGESNLLAADYYMCRECGRVYVETPLPENCTTCNSPSKDFLGQHAKDYLERLVRNY